MATALQPIIDNASSGGTIDLGGQTCLLTSAVTISKPLTLKNGHIYQLSGGNGGLVLQSSGINLVNLDLVGPQFRTRVDAEVALSCVGTAQSPLDGLVFDNVRTDTWGMYAFFLDNCTNVTIKNSRAFNTCYGAILLSSVLTAIVANNYVRTVVGAPNAYGIQMTRTTGLGLADHPRCNNILVANNTVEDMPNWEGIGCHGAMNVNVNSNSIINCLVGIDMGEDHADNYPPVNCRINGNSVVWSRPDGSGSYGITVNGVGSTNDPATGCSITNNRVYDCGDQTSAYGGALYVRNTSGLYMGYNQWYRPAPQLSIYHDNQNFVSDHDYVEDAWTNAVASGQADAIFCGGPYNVGTVQYLTVVNTGRKAATWIDTPPNVRWQDYASNSVTILP